MVDPTPWHRSFRTRAGLILLLIAGTIIRFGHVNRDGFSLDEELTHAVVSDISSHGVPRLPSGFLYDRGLPYSYAAWLTGGLLGQDLPAYRTTSALFGVAGVLLAFLLGRKTGSIHAAFLTACFTAFAAPLIAASQWARFYSMFATLYLASYLLLWASLSNRRLLPLFFVTCALTAALHPLSLTLLPVILFAYLVAPDSTRLHRSSFPVLIGGATAMATVYLALHADQLLGLIRNALPLPIESLSSVPVLPPPPIPVLAHTTALSLTLAILPFTFLALLLCRHRLVGLPFALSAIFLSALFQLGALLLLAAWSVLLRPRRLPHYAFAVLLVGTAAVASWTIHTVLTTDAMFTLGIPRALFLYSIRYPFDALYAFVVSWPLLSLSFALYCGLICTHCYRGSSARYHRTIIVCFLATVTIVGTLTIPLKARYFLAVLPFAFTGAAFVLISTAAMATRQPPLVHLSFRLRAGIASASVIAIAFLLALEQSGAGLGRHMPLVGDYPAASILEPLPTISSRRISDIIRPLRSNVKVVSNDEMAAHQLVGRVDFWLYSPTGHERTVTRQGVRRGYYAGAEVLPTVDVLVARLLREPEGDYLILLIGNGKFPHPRPSKLARELRDRLQARVTEIAAPGLAVIRVSM